jgi:hypothetical protein
MRPAKSNKANQSTTGVNPTQKTLAGLAPVAGGGLSFFVRI